VVVVVVTVVVAAAVKESKVKLSPSQAVEAYRVVRG
jgi:hypothetical protein